MDWVKNKQTPRKISDPPSSVAHITETTLDGYNVDTQSKKEDAFDAVVSMMPKQMARKAGVLVHYIKSKVKLDENGRVVYEEDGGRESLGSHLHDLIKFFVANPILKVPRPIDSVKFGILLTKLGVPRAALGRDISLIRTTPTHVPNRQPQTSFHSALYQKPSRNRAKRLQHGPRKIQWKSF